MRFPHFSIFSFHPFSFLVSISPSFCPSPSHHSLESAGEIVHVGEVASQKQAIFHPISFAKVDPNRAVGGCWTRIVIVPWPRCNKVCGVSGANHGDDDGGCVDGVGRGDCAALSLRHGLMDLWVQLLCGRRGEQNGTLPRMSPDLWFFTFRLSFSLQHSLAILFLLQHPGDGWLHTV